MSGYSRMAESMRCLRIRMQKMRSSLRTDLNGGILGADNPTFHATIGWDWITSTPGREVGIWNDVYLTSSDGVRVSDPVVLSRVDGTSGKASMTAAAILKNDMDSAAEVIVRGWIGDIKFEAIALGNGTASRETSEFIKRLRLPQGCKIWTVSEDGASIYSASEAAREEFHDEDVTVRGAVSIGRRLMDPL